MRNELIVRVQPQEAIYLKCVVKKPGMSFDTTQVRCDDDIRTIMVVMVRMMMVTIRTMMTMMMMMMMMMMFVSVLLNVPVMLALIVAFHRLFYSSSPLLHSIHPLRHTDGPGSVVQQQVQGGQAA